MALTLMAAPILLVIGSATPPSHVARTANLVVAGLYVPVTAFNILGEDLVLFYGVGIALEL